MGEVTIRPMRGLDAGDMAALEADCFSQPWSEAQMAGEMDNPTAVYFCAEVGGEFAGFAGMHDILGEGYVTNIAVAASFRRKGIGRRLTIALLEYAKTHTLDYVTLEVRASNAEAIALYESLGFTRQGKRKGFYQDPVEDGWIMTSFHSQWEELRTGF